MSVNVHMGELLKAAMKEKRINKTSLAKDFGCSRQHIYDLIETKDIELSVMKELGKLMGYNFAEKIKELNDPIYKATDPDIHYKSQTPEEEISELKRELAQEKEKCENQRATIRLQQDTLTLLHRNNELLEDKVRQLTKEVKQLKDAMKNESKKAGKKNSRLGT